MDRPARRRDGQIVAGGITAQMIISGTASTPTLRPTSIPELPQDEVLARVLFGTDKGQITPIQGLQLAQAAAALASGGPGALDRIRGTLGLDRLDIGSGDQQATTSTAPTVPGAPGSTSNRNSAGKTTISAGKYVAEGVYVGVEQDVSGQSKATVEVEIAPNVTVNTQSDTAGNAGFGLDWRRDY